MKLKLFLFSIFVILGLVAYKQYLDFSKIKSVDSYESCIAAKGSLIQEAYPATCITRLGANYTQSLTQSLSTPLPSINNGLHYINSDWKFELTLPASWEGYKAKTNNYKQENLHHDYTADICFYFQDSDTQRFCILQIVIYNNEE